MKSSESSDSDMDWRNEKDDLSAKFEMSTREEGGRPKARERGRGIGRESRVREREGAGGV